MFAVADPEFPRMGANQLSDNFLLKLHDTGRNWTARGSEEGAGQKSLVAPIDPRFKDGHSVNY